MNILSVASFACQFTAIFKLSMHDRSFGIQHGANGIKQVLLSSQTEQVPSNIQAKETRYHSFASVNNINGIRYSLNHR